LTTDLSKFNNTWFKPGSKLKLITWFLVNALIFNNPLFPYSGIKVIILRLFGATVGKKVLIKPSVNIKYPWLLEIGNHVWIGENVWIDNLALVTIGNNVCISQGAMLLCGNHDYKKSTFDLMVGSIIIKDGVWIAAKTVVCPCVVCGTHSILTVGSVANKSLDPYGIYKGNPAVKVKDR